MPREWACACRADCCRQPPFVVMTHQERAAIEQVTTRPLSWLPDVDPRFVRLSAGPCPLLDEQDHCTVYDVRPFNCRRYMCFREAGEPWTEDSLAMHLRADNSARLQYRSNQHRAQEWARAHGWPS